MERREEDTKELSSGLEHVADVLRSFTVVPQDRTVPVTYRFSRSMAKDLENAANRHRVDKSVIVRCAIKVITAKLLSMPEMDLAADIPAIEPRTAVLRTYRVPSTMIDDLKAAAEKHGLGQGGVLRLALAVVVPILLKAPAKPSPDKQIA